MKISFELLSRFVDLREISPEILAERLTLSGLEVSGLEHLAPQLNGVVAGRLRSVVPHPNADKLSLTEVEIPGEILKVVCGAKNIATGDVVPVALVGATLPGGITIKNAKIRGEESFGMLCSERELGLSPEAQGIMHLPPDTPLGTPVAQLLGSQDTLLQIEITPNRADCLSHLGVARQVAGILDRALTLPDITLTEAAPDAAQVASVEIEPESGCGRYCARILRGVKVGPSPAWLKSALERLGQRSVNNLVDVTNYVMLELGHPLHAFDLDRLNGSRAIARRAKAGERLVTLDGETRNLQGGELVIADADRPVALAGIMGGRDSEVTEKTVNLLLESAWFSPQAVRETSRRQTLKSEASYRFERGMDPEIGLTLALDRAAQLIAEVGGGTILRGILDQYPGRKPAAQIDLSLEKAERILGFPLLPAKTLAALSRLGFLAEPAAASQNHYSVRIPSFRQDVTQEENLIEEIAEALGYDQIPVTTPLVPMNSPAVDPRRAFLRECRTLAAGLGLTEVVSYSFLNPAHFQSLRLGADHPWRQALALKNPLSEETSLMRTSLLPGLLETAVFNQRRGKDRIYAFETGAVFLPHAGQELPQEPQHAGIILTGSRHPLDWRTGQKIAMSDFYDLEGILTGLCERLHLKQTGPGFHFETLEMPFLHPAISYRFLAPDGRELGWAGMLHPECQEAYKLKHPVLAAELDLEQLYTYRADRSSALAFSRFPASVQDLSLAVPLETQAGEVLHAIREAGGDMLVDVIPFDVYRGEGVKTGHKSLSFSLTFQASDRTLLEEEIRELHAGIVSRLQKRFGAEQR